MATSKSYSEVQETRFGRDIALPGLGNTVHPTASGDWPTVAGRENLLGAQIRRATVAPGQMVHRPLYGGGLPLYIEALGDPATLSRIEVAIRQNALRDDRIEEATVSAVLIDTYTQVQLEIQPRGENTTETATLLKE